MKFLRTLVVLGLAFVTMYVCSTSVSAEDTEETQVYIHKLILPDDKEGNSLVINNSGQELSKEELKQYQGLNGVEFSIYDITNLLNEELGKDNSLQGAQKNLIQKQYSLETMQTMAQTTTATVDGNEGLGSFSLPYDGNQHAYLIVESKTPENVKVKADQLVLITPLYNEFGNPMKTIHIYPKNISKSVEPIIPKPPKEEEPKDRKNFPTSNGTSDYSKNYPRTGEEKRQMFGLGAALILLAGFLFYVKNSFINEKKKNYLE